MYCEKNVEAESTYRTAQATPFRIVSGVDMSLSLWDSFAVYKPFRSYNVTYCETLDVFTLFSSVYLTQIIFILIA